jgi:transcriptional regulator with XRE-family HTH domain
MAEKSKDPESALGQRIDQLRRASGLSVEELANRADLDRSQLESLLHGVQDVGIFVLIRLAGALGVEPGEILDTVTWVPRRDGGEYRMEAADED